MPTGNYSVAAQIVQKLMGKIYCVIVLAEVEGAKTRLKVVDI
jgi:hypothetical protein